MPWGDRESWLLPLNVRSKFEKEFNTLMAEHNEAKENYFTDYPGLVRVRKAKQELGGLFNARLYPSLQEIRKMFRCELIYSPIPTSGHFVADIADDMKKALDDAMVSRVSAACNSLVDRVQDRLVDYVDKLSGYSGSRDGRFNDSLVGNLDDIGNLIKELNFTGDTGIQKLSADVSRLARFSAQNLREYGETRQAAINEGKGLLSRIETYKNLNKEVDDTFSTMAEIEL